MIYGIALFTLRVSVVIIDRLGFRVIAVFDAHGAVSSIGRSTWMSCFAIL